MTTLRHTVVLENYPLTVQTAAAQRPKYYEPKDRKLITQKLALKLHSGEVIWQPQKNGTSALYDTVNNEFILRNASKAGQPRFVAINANLLWSSGMAVNFTRQKIRDFLHGYFESEIKRQLPAEIEVPKGKYIQFVFKFYDTLSIGRMKPDLTNRSFIFQKVFEDVLQDLHVITQDNSSVVRGSYTQYIDIMELEGSQQRRLEIEVHLVENNKTIS